MSIELLDSQHASSAFDMQEYEADLARPRLTLIAGGGGGAAMGPDFIEQFSDHDVTIVTGVGDGGVENPNDPEARKRGGATGEARRIFDTVALGDARNILAAVSGNAAGAILNTRYQDEAQLQTFHETGARFLATMAARNEELSAAGRTDELHDMERIARTVDDAAILAGYLMEETGRTNLDGHTWGTFFLTALEMEHNGDAAKAVDQAGVWLETRASVKLSTIVRHEVIENDNGHIVIGEGDADMHEVQDPIKVQVGVLALDPHVEVDIHPDAYDAIANPDKLGIIAGSMVTTQMAILSVKGMREAIAAQSEHGELVVIANLEKEKTLPGMTLDGHGQKLAEVMDRRPDLFVYNQDTDSLPEGSAMEFSPEAETHTFAAAVVGASLVSHEVVVHSKTDSVAQMGLRSSVHHNVPAVAAIMRRELPMPVAA